MADELRRLTDDEYRSLWWRVSGTGIDQPATIEQVLAFYHHFSALSLQVEWPRFVDRFLGGWKPRYTFPEFKTAIEKRVLRWA